ncbi:MAG: DUF262 domain-containing protein [Verrucomicrobiota bacterium]
MSDSNVTLKSVNDLLTTNFFIPSYQRGYRWSEVQVTDLLNDLWEFQGQSNKMESSGFYCLQPLVVKMKENGSCEVVDGQQRLTTIFLILTYLKPTVEVLGKSPFSLSFETRSETCETFLKDINLARSDENIDFHHISNAYKAIGLWFEKRDGSHKIRLLQTLLNDDEVGRNVKVIWYELPKTEDAIEAFTRLNIGKIPLTNSELIRALFLRSDNFGLNTRELQQLRIAQEWDLIEKTLQTSDFWYFIHSGQNTPANRIEYLFELMVDEAQPDTMYSGDPYRSFHYYNGLLKSRETLPEQEWLNLKQFHMMLEEWFHDRTLYHLTGFLIHIGVSITELRREALKRPKSSFAKFLRQRIFCELFGKSNITDEDDTLAALIGQKLTEMYYGSSKPRLRSVLLLFNIATLFENDLSNLRFPFDSFKQENWDIEHISSVDSDKPDRPDSQKEWLRTVLLCYSDISGDSAWLPQIEAVLSSSPFDKAGFDKIYDQILKQYGEEESSEADHQIENLTLLDQSTNRSYKNAVFPVKRHRILSLDRSGTFVPLCTRNIFLKCYSRKLDDMLRWNKGDKLDYRNQIIATLAAFFHNLEIL